jgi:hypothetical protein
VLGPLLYLSGTGGLVPVVPAQGELSLAQGTAALASTVPLEAPLALDGAPSVVLLQRLVAKHGTGHPRAVVTVSLQDCGSTGCRVLATATSRLDRAHGYVAQRLALSRVTTTVPVGHVLRLAVSLGARENVDRVLLACGGARPSRLDLA